MFIIGLCGFAGSGKSTIAKHLIQKYGFERLSFAAPVKDVSAHVFGWERSRLEGITDEDRAWRELPDEKWSRLMGYPFTPRMGLQLVGNNVREMIHSDVWVEAGIEQIKRKPISSKLIFDDVRYVNERMYLRSAGARIFTVHRQGDRGLEFPSPEHIRLWRQSTDDTVLSTEETPLHRSEWDWLRDKSVDTDPIIGNVGSLNLLHKEVDSLLQTDILKHDESFHQK